MPHSSLPKLLAFVCVFAFLFSAAGSNAQVMTADITGTVTDSTGAVLAGAKVTLKNVGTGASQTQQTGSSGDYTFALLRSEEHTSELQSPVHLVCLLSFPTRRSSDLICLCIRILVFSCWI